MDDVLREVCYNRETGFSSIDETLWQARALNNARAARAQRLGQPYVYIRVDREDVKRVLDSQEVRQKTMRKRCEGSYVPVAAREEFECDLAEFDSGRRYMLVCVDVFSKRCAAVPMDTSGRRPWWPRCDSASPSSAYPPGSTPTRAGSSRTGPWTSSWPPCR